MVKVSKNTDSGFPPHKIAKEEFKLNIFNTIAAVLEKTTYTSRDE